MSNPTFAYYEAADRADARAKRVKELERQLRKAEAQLAAVPALVERHRKFAQKVLDGDNYGCDAGPNKCLHADARRELEAIAKWEQAQGKKP